MYTFLEEIAFSRHLNNQKKSPAPECWTNDLLATRFAFYHCATTTAHQTNHLISDYHLIVYFHPTVPQVITKAATWEHLMKITLKPNKIYVQTFKATVLSKLASRWSNSYSFCLSRNFFWSELAMQVSIFIAIEIDVSLLDFWSVSRTARLGPLLFDWEVEDWIPATSITFALGQANMNGK